MPAPAANTSRALGIEDITFVSWNVHVGNGDVRAFVADLRAGVHTDGRKIDHYVLMLQEAVRTDGVPAFAADMSGAERIAAHGAADSIDIVQVARDLGALTALRTVDAQRQVGGRPGGGSRQRHPLDLAALRSDGDRAARRGSAPRRHPRRAARCRSERSISMRSAAGTCACGCSGVRGCGMCRSDRWWLPARWSTGRRRRSEYLARPRRARRQSARPIARDPGSVDRQGLGLRVLDYLFFRAGANRRARTATFRTSTARTIDRWSAGSSDLRIADRWIGT